MNNLLQNLFQQLQGINGEDGVWEVKVIFRTKYEEQLHIDLDTSAWIH